MVDTIDSFLNNAVDLYVQAVDYRRILTSQILTPVSAKIRQPSPDSGCIVPDSGQTGRIPSHIAGILDRSDRSGRISCQIWPGRLGSGRFVRDSGRDRWNPAQMARFRSLSHEFVCVKYKKKYFYIILYFNFFKN
jgi:hypothetical protein